MTHTAWIFINHHHCSSHFCWDAQDQLLSSRLHLYQLPWSNQVATCWLHLPALSNYPSAGRNPPTWSRILDNFGTLWGDRRCHSSQNAPMGAPECFTCNMAKDMKRWLESSTCSSERNSFLPIHKYWAIIRKITPIPIVVTTPPLLWGLVSKLTKNSLLPSRWSGEAGMPQDWQIAPEWLCGSESCYTWKVAFFESMMLPEVAGVGSSLPKKTPVTPPKLNIELENKLCWKKESLFGKHYFQVSQDWYNT